MVTISKNFTLITTKFLVSKFCNWLKEKCTFFGVKIAKRGNAALRQLNRESSRAWQEGTPQSRRWRDVTNPSAYVTVSGAINCLERSGSSSAAFPVAYAGRQGAYCCVAAWLSRSPLGGATPLTLRSVMLNVKIVVCSPFKCLIQLIQLIKQISKLYHN